MKKILHNAFPAIVSFASVHVYALVNFFWLSRLDTGYIAAVTVFMAVFWLFDAWVRIIDGGTIPLVSRYFGANDLKTTETYVLTSLILDGIIAVILFIVCHLFLESILGLIGVKGLTLEYALTYGRTVIWVFLLMPIVISFTSVFRTTGSPMLSMALIILLTVLNMILDPVLIFGVGKIPPFGLKGAAYATILSFVLTVIAGTFLFSSRYAHVSIVPVLIKEIRLHHVTDLLRLGLPAAFSAFLLNAAVFLTISLVNTYGVEITSVCGVQVRLMMLFTIISSGYGVGVGSILGNYLGAGSKETILLAYKATKGIFVVNLFFASMIFAFSSPIARLLFRDPNDISIATFLNRLIAISLFFYCMGIFFQIILLYVGYIRQVFIVNLVTTWVLGMPLLLFSVLVLHVSYKVFFILLLVNGMVACLCNSIMFFRKKWLTREIVPLHSAVTPLKEYDA